MRGVVSVGATYQAARMRVAISCITIVHKNDIRVCGQRLSGTHVKTLLGNIPVSDCVDEGAAEVAVR